MSSTIRITQPPAAASKQLMETRLTRMHRAVSITLAYSPGDCTSFWLLPLKAPPLCLLMATLERERAGTPALCTGLTAFLRTAQNPEAHRDTCGRQHFPPEDQRQAGLLSRQNLHGWVRMSFLSLEASVSCRDQISWVQRGRQRGLAANPERPRLPRLPGEHFAFVFLARMSLLQETDLIVPVTSSSSQDHTDKDHGLFVLEETDGGTSILELLLGKLTFAASPQSRTCVPLSLLSPSPGHIPF